MAATGILHIQTLAEIMTQNSLLPIPTAALAVEDSHGRNQQILPVMAVTGTGKTQRGVVPLMMMILLLQKCVEPAGPPMPSLQESRSPIQ